MCNAEPTARVIFTANTSLEVFSLRLETSLDFFLAHIILLVKLMIKYPSVATS